MSAAPLFQIGRTPMRALDLVLPSGERRVADRRQVQLEWLKEADRRHNADRRNGRFAK